MAREAGEFVNLALLDQIGAFQSEQFLVKIHRVFS
jgi:hypothetical protein